MDLATLRTDSEDGAELVILHPKTREPIMTDGKPLTIRLASITSKQYLEREAEIIEKRRGLKKVTSEYLREEAAETLAKVTLSWQGVEFNGEELPCTIANAKKIYMVPGLKWLREQVDLFVADEANFIKPSQTD